MATPHTCEGFMPRPFSCALCRRQARGVFWGGVGLAITAGVSWLATRAATAAVNTGSAIAAELKAKDTDVDQAQDEAIALLAGRVEKSMPEAKADTLIKLLSERAEDEARAKAARAKRPRPY